MHTEPAAAGNRLVSVVPPVSTRLAVAARSWYVEFPYTKYVAVSAAAAVWMNLGLPSTHGFPRVHPGSLSPAVVSDITMPATSFFGGQLDQPAGILSLPLTDALPPTRMLPRPVSAPANGMSGESSRNRVP